MQLAHLGVAVFVVGVTLSGLSIRAGRAHGARQHSERRRFTVSLHRRDERGWAKLRAARAEIIVSRNGKEIERMYPEKRNYNASGNVMTEAAIDSGLFRDLYVSMGEPVNAGAWSVRVYYKPFIGWIW